MPHTGTFNRAWPADVHMSLYDLLRAEQHCSGLGLPLGGVAHQPWLHIWELSLWQMRLLLRVAHRSAQHLSAERRQLSWHISRAIYTASEAEQILVRPAAE